MESYFCYFKVLMHGLEFISSYQPYIIKRMPNELSTNFASHPKTFFQKHSFKNFLKLILDCNVFICDFHHEEAWERCLNAIKYGARMIKNEMLCKFRRIARSKAEMLQMTYEIVNNGRVTTWVWITDLKSNGYLISKYLIL